MTSVVAMSSVTPVTGKPKLLLGAYDIASVGYTANEYFISGSARAYGEGPLPEAEYTTRIVALTPTDSSKFNGTVLVEWLNVSGGIDAPAVWFMAHREMIREGYAYIGVSAQKGGRRRRPDHHRLRHVAENARPASGIRRSAIPVTRTRSTCSARSASWSRESPERGARAS